MDNLNVVISYVAENIVGVVVFCLGAMFVGHVAYEGSRRSRKAEAAAVFRGAFKDVILNLRENQELQSAQIADLDYYAILSAAQQYRIWVYCLRRRAFDKAVAQYKEACEISKDGGSVFALFASETTDFAKAKRKILDDAVHRLYAFGKET